MDATNELTRFAVECENMAQSARDSLFCLLSPTTDECSRPSRRGLARTGRRGLIEFELRRESNSLAGRRGAAKGATASNDFRAVIK